MFVASLSGALAAQSHLALSAHNTANVNTPGFKSLQASQVAAPQLSGTQVAKVQENLSAGPLIPGDFGNLSLLSSTQNFIEGSNVDLTKEVVNQIIAQHSFEANLSVIKSQDELTESLLEITA